jgi:L-ribulose-5-phosphate 4-epimerase
VGAYDELREEAFAANLEIPARALAIYTWGNVSAFDPARGVFAIKPSGVDYADLEPDSMVVVDLSCAVVEGNLNPSSDTRTHAEIYKAFGGPGLRGITHTHSPYAVAWAQARLDIPVFGTTHADHLAVPVPCTDWLSESETAGDYEENTGHLVVRTFAERGLDPAEVEMILVGGHGPFTWGKTAMKSVYHAAVLEEMAKMASVTVSLGGMERRLPPWIVKKHWERKHGEGAYYGQERGQDRE